MIKHRFTIIAPRKGSRQLLRSMRFTLIELLIVITVIAILSAMLLPALRQAKANAQRAACANNVRQIAVGFQLYLDSYDTYFPFTGYHYVGAAGHLGGTPVSSPNWYDALLPELGYEIDTTGGNADLAPTYRCPSNPSTRPPDDCVIRDEPKRTIPYMYTYNGALGGEVGSNHANYDGKTVKLSRVTRPEKTFTIFDGNEWRYGGNILFRNETDPLTCIRVGYYRHMMTVNVGFVDGHVSAIKGVYGYGFSKDDVACSDYHWAGAPFFE